MLQPPKVPVTLPIRAHRMDDGFALIWVTTDGHGCFADAGQIQHVELARLKRVLRRVFLAAQFDEVRANFGSLFYRFHDRRRQHSPRIGCLCIGIVIFWVALDQWGHFHSGRTIFAIDLCSSYAKFAQI